MFAVIKTGGKQYRVSADEELTIERLAASAGDTVQFNEVLMLGGDGAPTVGAPFVEGAAVQAEVLDAIRGPKTISFKKRRRKHSSARRKGHRQNLTIVKITEILASGGDKTGVMAAVGAGSVAAMAAVAEAAPKPAKAEKKAAPKPEPKAEPKAEAPAEAPADAAVEVEGERPANLLDAAQGEPDDLKKISGVGPKLEGLLHENGVFHFWQIAEWGPSEIAYMDDKLSFKGRIERDNWIAQAKDFAAAAE